MFFILYNVSAWGFLITSMLLAAVTLLILVYTHGTAALLPPRFKLQLLDNGLAELHKQQISRLEATVADYNTRLAASVQLTHELEIARAELDLNRGRLASAQTELDRSRLDKKHLRRQIQRSCLDQENELRNIREEHRAFEQNMEKTLAAKAEENGALEKSNKQLSGQVSLIVARGDLHFKKLQASVKEIRGYKAILEKAKTDRASLLESLQEAKVHLEQADINNKALMQEYREHQHQRDTYRDQEAKARQQLENRRGNDGRHEAHAAQQAAQKAIQERRVAEKKVNDLAVRLQLANVKYTDTTSQLERASELIASLRSECAAAKKERDEFEKQIHRKTTASTRAAFIDRENTPCF